MYNCDCTKSHWIVHFKWVNCVVSELYLNKAFVQKLLEKSNKCEKKGKMYGNNSTKRSIRQCVCHQRLTIAFSSSDHRGNLLAVKTQWVAERSSLFSWKYAWILLWRVHALFLLSNSVFFDKFDWYSSMSVWNRVPELDWEIKC